MRVTQLPMQPGSWDCKLKDTTPYEVTDKLRIRRSEDTQPDPTFAAFGTVLVTPEHIDLDGGGPAAVYANVCYVGRLRTRENRVNLGGDGIEGWLGDGNGRGFMRQYGRTGPTATFANYIDDIRTFPFGGTAIPLGTFTAIGGSFDLDNTGYITQRDALLQICRAFAAEWRLNPDFTLDAGTTDDIYGDPVAFFHPDARGPEPGMEILSGKAQFRESCEEYEYTCQIPGYAPHRSANGWGDPWTPGTAGAHLYIDRRVDISPTPLSNAPGVAILLADPIYTESLTIELDSYNLELQLCGKKILVYDTDKDIFDVSADQVFLAGELCQPLEQRVVELEFEVPKGAGVYFVNADGSLDLADRPMTDLTEHVEFPDTKPEVAATLTCGRPIPGWEQAARARYTDDFGLG